MSLAVVYSRKAKADLDEIFDFIASDNPRRARSYIGSIQRACRGLRVTPMMGVGRSDLRPGIRVLPLWRRIVIAYEVKDDRIEILRVFSAGQDYEAVMRSD
jgi:toxin ParE1/3/4